ncbi:MAG: VirD4-like conjugal transfer protein, CD1115 family [Suilimivivens sp.]
MNRINATRFMTQEEMMERLVEIDLKETGGFSQAGIPLLVKDQKAYVDVEDNHTIIFGATGSKKTRLFGMPSVEILSRAGESFVVTDPKGEIYQRTVENVTQRGYQIYCLNLRDFKQGVTWNPLTLPYDYYHGGEKSKAVEMVSELAGMLAGESLQDPFWSETARDVLTGFMMILLESAQREECNIKSVLALWEQYLDEKEKMMRNIKRIYGNSLITRKLGSLNNDSSKTVGSIEAVVATGLNKLASHEEFVEFLSQEGMEFEAVTKGKTAIYLIVPDENKFYHFVASLFLEQLYQVLIKEAQKSSDGRLAIRMNYIVDEFANIPKMNNIDSMITASRSRNIRFNLIVQSKMQLEDKYEGLASVICDNCTNWVYLYSKDYGLLNEISRLCGEVIYDNHMTLPLISEFELQHLRKEEGEALVLAGRNYPCIVNLADIEQYPGNLNAGKSGRKMLKQNWEPASVFKMRCPKNSNTCCYELTYEEQERKKAKEKLKRDVWLVGTCNGVIIADDMITGEEAASGRGILKLCLNEFTDLKDALELKWYVASEVSHSLYNYQLRNKVPEMVFITLQEFGMENFRPVHGAILERVKGVGLC